MTFYTESYIVNHQQINSLVNYIIIFILFLLIAGTFIYYFRHRLQIKYRDLGIIFFLLLLIFAGLQITNLEKSYTQQSQVNQMQPFIKAVARDHKLSSKRVLVNSTTLTDGIIVRFKGKDYRVNFSPSGDNYTLTRTHVVNHEVNVQR